MVQTRVKHEISPMGTRGFFRECKVVEAWSYTSTPPIRLHVVVYRYNFTFTLPFYTLYQD